jgi:hypothetical protein
MPNILPIKELPIDLNPNEDVLYKDAIERF